MRQRLTLWIVMLSLAGALSVVEGPRAASEPDPPTLSTLQPGGFRTIGQHLEVNLVFIGYDAGTGPREIDFTTFDSLLPHTSRALHRTPALYGIRQPMGLEFQFSYHRTLVTQAYEDAFFTYLLSLASPQPLTAYQTLYNLEAPRALTIPDNSWIDAPSVERWLVAHPPSGVDTSRYTIFFINWYDRPDFIHHVYTKTNEPDPDTGYNFGEIRASRKMMAWGGTPPDDPEDGNGKTSRIWFYDLSAGPESWTDNWNITTADLDDDDALDYRMPPIWEYGNPKAGLYRAIRQPVARSRAHHPICGRQPPLHGVSAV
jgi:hypothetical protein